MLLRSASSSGHRAPLLSSRLACPADPALCRTRCETCGDRSSGFAPARLAGAAARWLVSPPAIQEIEAQRAHPLKRRRAPKEPKSNGLREPRVTHLQGGSQLAGSNGWEGLCVRADTADRL